MADLPYLNIRDALSAAHWNEAYTELQRRLNIHFNHYSILLWGDAKWLSHRRYFVFGSTPVKHFLDPGIANESENVMAIFNDGGYLVTSDTNHFFRDYDQSPFYSAIAAATLANSPRPGVPYPQTASLGPTILVNKAGAFNDAYTGSCFPLRAGTISGWAIDEYLFSLFYSPEAHRKEVVFGPEYGGQQYNCYLTVDGAVNPNDTFSYIFQPGPEHVDPFLSAEWFIFDVGPTWVFPTYETKERFHRIHNISSVVLTVNFAGTAWMIPPMGCLAVRRNTLTEFTKMGGGDGVNSSYFYRFQFGDPIVSHQGVNGLDCGGNNVADPDICNEMAFYLNAGYFDPVFPARYDKSLAYNINPIYCNPTYIQQSYESPMPSGSWYDLDESKPIGNLLCHRGNLILASVNEIREHQSASFIVDNNQNPHLLRMSDDGLTIAPFVDNISVFSGSVSIAPNAGTTWTASGGTTSTNIIYWTGSTFHTGDTSLVTFTAKQPSNRKIIKFRGFEHLVADLALVSHSVDSAYSATLDPNSYTINCPDKDYQLGTISSNVLPILFNNSLWIDAHGNPPTFFGVLGPDQVVPVVTSVTQSVNPFYWLNASNFAFGVWTVVSTSSADIHNNWRKRINTTGSAPYVSMFEPQSTFLNNIRNFGGLDQDATVTSNNSLTNYGPTNVTITTVPVDYPGLNFNFSEGVLNDPLFDLDKNYQSGSGNLWTRKRATGAAFSLANDQFFGWAAPGVRRSGEIYTPRDRQGYAVPRLFLQNPSSSNFVISGTLAPYYGPPSVYPDFSWGAGSTYERAGLYNFYEQPDGKFLNYDTGSNDWRNTLAPYDTHEMESIAFLRGYSSSPDKEACLNGWLNVGKVYYNGGFIDFTSGSARFTSYFPDQKFNLLSNTNSDDDNTIGPKIFHTDVETHNIARSGINHSFGTVNYAGTWQPNDYFLVEGFFPANSKDRGFTSLLRSVGKGSLNNIRPLESAHMWRGTSISGAGDWPGGDASASIALAAFGVTMKTAADIADAKFQSAITKGTCVEWGYVDIGGGTGWHTSIYPYGDISNGSQSLFAEANGYWQSTYSFGGAKGIPIDQIRYITFADKEIIANKMGFSFSDDPEVLVPLAFDYIVAAGMTNLQDDNSGVYAGGSYLFSVGGVGFYNKYTGSSAWVADTDDYASIRNDTSQIKDLVTNCEPSPTPGIQNALLKFDYGRLPELWHPAVSMPSQLSQNPYCMTSPVFNDDREHQHGFSTYLYRHYGPASGSYRGQALISPMNSIRYGRGHVTSLHNYAEWIAFVDYPSTAEWFSIPKSEVISSVGGPFAIPFLDTITVIEAPTLEFGQLDILPGFHNFSTD